ncbi:hypothetical protein HMSSN139_42460 [Paenibacillus sp. HMSSN-139]|nr:hypothetical protein HMSSN139_42460 [Paenibacillus sp. HMSSN-139]
MTNALSKITAALLAVLLLFLFPLAGGAAAGGYPVFGGVSRYGAVHRRRSEQGVVTPTMYEDFIRELETTGGGYEVELEHRHKTYHPEYGDPADPATFLNGFSVVYDSYYTSDILEAMFPTGAGQEGEAYKLQEGDFIAVTALDHNRSPYDILSEFLYPGADKANSSLLTYGGMVLNEDY